MAKQLGVFKVIGNSNIRNAFSTRLKLSERISGQTTEFISAVAYSSGLLALSNLGQANTVLVSFLVNGLVDATELCTDLEAVDKVLETKTKEYLAAITMTASINPETKFYMMPPMTRTTPIWFESKLGLITEIMAAQSVGISNLVLLPHFVVLTKDLEADGVHLDRKTQSRLFNHIMEELFPGGINVKTRNISRDRIESDDDAASPPSKKTNGRAEEGSGEIEIEMLVDGGSPAAATQPEGPSPSTSGAPMMAEARAKEEDGIETMEIRNPDLQQLYQMLSKKIDSAKDVTTGLQSKIADVSDLAIKTTKQVETHTFLLRSLHLRTAKQAELLDSHSNTLNLNVVMISGVPETIIRSPSGEPPSTKSVMEKIIKYTPLLISGIKFATYAKYIKHQEGKLPNIKAFFINAETALAFRDSANKLRIAKKDFWTSVYVSNDPTKSTRVRIAILRALAKRLAPLPANAGKTIFVSKFDVKTTLDSSLFFESTETHTFIVSKQSFQKLLQHRLSLLRI